MNEHIMHFRVGVMVLATFLERVDPRAVFHPIEQPAGPHLYDLHQVQRRPGRGRQHSGPQGGHPHRPGTERAVRQERHRSDRHGGHRKRPSSIYQRAVPGNESGADGRCLAGFRAAGECSKRKGRKNQRRRHPGREIGRRHDRLGCRPAKAGDSGPGRAHRGRPRHRPAGDQRRGTVGKKQGPDPGDDHRDACGPQRNGSAACSSSNS